MYKYLPQRIQQERTQLEQNLDVLRYIGDDFESTGEEIIEEDDEMEVVGVTVSPAVEM